MKALIASALTAMTLLATPATAEGNHHLSAMSGLSLAQLETMSLTEISVAIFAHRATAE
ncbi:hypothetical protein [Roseobacter sp. HKCCA0434]|uniref:hypothetical protein n=1 Tax=Roseobacter sp. HKCCA0434 TaxID=3079297 RepID=UPI00290581E8|nr:hypothetical protein [Roseobacter sp. HKCCA0434]